MDESQPTPAAAGSQSPKPAPAARPAENSSGGIKDTIESILVAFILAFIFRAFVVEAFVIPTGSMAPTLLGAHMRFQCKDCGYQFDVNYSPKSDGDDITIDPNAGPVPETRYDPVEKQNIFTGRMLPKIYNLHCPNCGYKVAATDVLDENNDATNPAVRYGDRILVLKYLYLFQEPRRWDVVVFKSPVDPGTYHYQQNYIKRLIGKPGESVMVLDGDAYIAPGGQGSKTEDEYLKSFTVQTKPRDVQRALWRIVADNDYYPQGLKRLTEHLTEPVNGQWYSPETWVQPWQVRNGSGWDLGTNPSDGRIFRFHDTNAAGTIAFNADANPAKQALTDWLAYDVTENQPSGGPANTYDTPERIVQMPVSDLKLEFYYQRQGDGALRLRLSKLDDVFTAEFTTTAVTLSRTRAGRPAEVLGQRPLKKSGPMRIEFQNVDYQVSVRVDGEDLIQTTPQQYAPNVKQLLEAYRSNIVFPRPTVEIEAEREQCSISHLRLWRDVYYRNREQRQSLQWAIPENFPEHLAILGDDEYFVMGDNSVISGDARYWGTPIKLPHEQLDVQSGRVPGRFLLGKAFFVYWPAGYRPTENAPALTPNFAEMRFIH